MIDCLERFSISRLTRLSTVFLSPEFCRSYNTDTDTPCTNTQGPQRVLTHASMASLSEPRIVAEAWLSSFASALISRDARAVANVFLSDGWLRDILTFTWDNRSLEGRDKIIDYLADTLPDKHVSEVQLSEEEHFRPVFLPMGSQRGLEFGYTFDV